MPPPLPVIYCFPRSGGTLLSQCLLCAESTVVLSEVNPAASVIAVERQAQEWFGLVTPREASALAAKPYLEKISLLARRCARRKRQLCVRDWVAINFLPPTHPAGASAQRRPLSKVVPAAGGLRTARDCLVAAQRDIFDSLRQRMPGFQRYTVPNFARHYGAYLAAIAEVPKFHLEDFTRKRRRRCGPIYALGLEFPARFEQQFHAQQHVTGNNILQTKPPSAALTRIAANRPRTAPRPAAAQATVVALDRLAGTRKP